MAIRRNNKQSNVFKAQIVKISCDEKGDR